MLSRTSSTFSLQTFAFLETCFYPAAGKKAREKDVAAGCGTCCRTEALIISSYRFSGASSGSTLKGEVNNSRSFSIVAKSQKRSLNSPARDIRVSAYFFVSTHLLPIVASREAGKCVVQGSVCVKCL